MVLMDLDSINKAAEQVEKIGKNWRKQEKVKQTIEKKKKRDLKMRADDKKRPNKKSGGNVSSSPALRN